MLTKEAFLAFILTGPHTAAEGDVSTESALPPGMDGFDPVGAGSTKPGASFARRLLEASGFGYAEMVQRDNVIRSTDRVACYLPERVSFWPKTPSRTYQTLLFEADLNHKQLLAIPAFRSRTMAHLDIVEDALARLVSEALDGFQRGGEGVTADVRRGRKEETLCVVSILDEREGQPVRLVCFGTQNRDTGGLETFQLTEQTRFWDPQLAREHLGLLFERQFKKLEGPDWQEAFTTTEERRQAEKLLDICGRKAPKEHDIQEGVLDLLDTIAKGFGLRKPPNRRRLQAFALPTDHDIGIDPEERDSSFGGKNPFSGVILRDERSRLLGYIIYPLRTRADASKLSKHLKANNRFHNVLVVYPEETQASLELWQGREQLTGKLRRGQGHKDAADVVNLLSRFFVVSRARVRNPTELAQELAYRARYLYRLALKQLVEEEPEEGPLRNLYNAFKEALVHDQTVEEFADAFAQTITYGLLTARWTGNDRLLADGDRFTRQTALRYLPEVSPFLNELFSSALAVKLDEQRGRLLWLVDDIADLLDRIDVAYVFGAGDAGADAVTDPIIHFYEPFLAAYDKDLKNKRGVFFTPRPVVSYIVRSIHELLQSAFGLEDGLASTDTWRQVADRASGFAIPPGVSPDDPFVCILDVATGTGTFLFECIEVIERTMKVRWCRELGFEDWSAPPVARLWTEYVTTHLLSRLYGYELMMAPYAIAHLKVAFKLAETGYTLGGRGPRVHIYLTDTLASPTAMADSTLADMFTSLAAEARDVGEVKRTKRFTVVLGNPPYLREKERGPGSRLTRIGGWVRFGDGGAALFDDFLRPLAERAQGVHAKLAYELSVMFWRLALWVVFERATGPGIVGMISPRAYIAGPGHAGMRSVMRHYADRIWVTDLGGDNRGARKSENVFDIETGVSIAICARTPAAGSGSEVRYSEIVGSAEEKLEELARSSVLSTTSWRTCPPNADTFLPTTTKAFDSWPNLVDLFPWQHSGSQFKRLWPIAESREVLVQRWNAFLNLPPGQRAAAFTETRDRVVAKPPAGSQSKRYTGLVAIPKGTAMPPAVRYCYRSLDRQWCLVDERLADFVRPSLVRTLGPRQLFAATLMSKPLGAGPAVSVTQHLPDMDVFCNRGAKDVIPLWRDERATQANVTRGLVAAISTRLGVDVRPEDLFCYCVAVLASPAYTLRFESDLATPGVHIPISDTADVFKTGVRLGAHVVWCQTLGEQWLGEAQVKPAGLSGNARIGRAISTGEGDYPRDYRYEKASETLFVGDGSIVQVASAVYDYSVSGFRVVDSWLRYRMATRGGRAGRGTTRSILDAIRPRAWTFSDELLQLLWAVEGCVALWPQLSSFLEAAAGGPQIAASELPRPSPDERYAPEATDGPQKRLL